MQENEIAGPPTPDQFEFSDTAIIRSLDEADRDEPAEKPAKEYAVQRDLLAGVYEVFSSSFVVLLTNTILSTGLFFSVVVLTLWSDCPQLIWGGFLIFCLVSPLALCVMNVRLLVSISKKQSCGRMTIREF